LLRQFLGSVIHALGGPQPVHLDAPLAIEPILRRQGDRRIIHLINRSSGWSTGPNDFAVESIPPAGPVTIEIKMPTRPIEVKTAWEGGKISWTWANSIVHLTLDHVRIHEAIVID
jgi:hypothetical protein